MASPFKVKALFEYSSPHEDDLNFSIGQIITVTDEEDADWYSGEYVGDDGVKREGIFPRNFVEKFEPTAPPRPIRSRHKKDSEAPHPPAPVEEPAAPPPPPAAPEEPALAPQPEPEPKIEEANAPVSAASAPSPSSPSPPEVSAPALLGASTLGTNEPPATASIPAPATVPSPGPSTAPSQPPKPKAGPPPVSEKPKSSSFKDRIAAFNKPAAPPIAPFKPSGLSGSGGAGFVKKPFVAPPPSRNAYVPPPQQAPTAKIYRREEDPEIKEREAETRDQAEKAGLAPSESQEGGDEDQPKPTSLKERIALLQKQQMEQAQRHAEAAAKKEKPKRPSKKRLESAEQVEGGGDALGTSPPVPAPLERRDTEDSGARTSTDEPRQTRAPPPPRPKSSKGPAAESVNDGNEADLSGAGDTTEGQEDNTERDDSDVASRRASHVPTVPTAAAPAAEQPKNDQDDEAEDEEEDEEEEDVDPEVKRKEELRARMAKMSGGMGFHGMFGAPMPAAAPPKKKKAPKAEKQSTEEQEEESVVPRGAPPIPTMMALPGMGGPRKSEEITRPEEESETTPRPAPPPIPSRQVEEEKAEAEEEDDDGSATPAPTTVPAVPPRDPTGPPPPIPGGRPAPPPVPSECSTTSPPPPPAEVKSQTEGSESDDELSGNAKEVADESAQERPTSPIASPMPPQPIQPPNLPIRSPPMSPRTEHVEPASPTASTLSKRSSRPPPPIPGSAPLPPPVSSRPPPPPPPTIPSRPSTVDTGIVSPTRPSQAGEENEQDAIEYEGDYDTDIASSVPHKDALKSHARDSSVEENSLKSPVSDAPPSLPPPIPTAPAPGAAPPPVPTQPPPENKRQSIDAPRAAPPPPPPSKQPPPQQPSPQQPTPQGETEYDPYNMTVRGTSFVQKTPKFEDEAFFPQSPQAAGSRAPGARKSTDMSRVSMNNRRSMDHSRPSVSMDVGFIANDIDLAVQSGWWKQSNQVPPVLQGRKDVFFECDESTSTNGGQKTTITREIFVLYQDYSQTFLTVRYDPYDPSDVELEQRHEPPPRPLRQDQMEEYYERFGRPIAEAVATKKDSIVGDGTPQGLICELLRPFKDALAPVGTRAYGALVYSNMANASTTLNDVIRPGDIITIRNAKFQGKHGPMHAKYSVEVGKPDHVAVVSEWDGTKKKVRAWEQGRESKKVKVESFKLDDLRSGEVKIWRVMPRSWVGWNSQP